MLPCLAGECTSNATVTAVVTGSGTKDGRITVTISNYPFNFMLPYFQQYVWNVSATGPYEFTY